MQRLKEHYIELLPQNIQEKKMKEWVKHYKNNILVYCNGCEKGLKIGGIERFIQQNYQQKIYKNKKMCI